MTYPIARVMPSYYVDSFKGVGIRTTYALLRNAAAVKDRKALAHKINVQAHDILDFINVADLMRIKGLGRHYIVLLKHAGVATVRELRYRNPDNLLNDMAIANGHRIFVAVLPSPRLVKQWIEQANQLPLMVTYR